MASGLSRKVRYFEPTEAVTTVAIVQAYRKRNASKAEAAGRTNQTERRCGFTTVGRTFRICGCRKALQAVHRYRWW
jgi:hypothetical protein